MNEINREQIRRHAEKALRTPDLEWAYDLVHKLATNSLALLAELEQAERELNRWKNQYKEWALYHGWTEDSTEPAELFLSKKLDCLEKVDTVLVKPLKEIENLNDGFGSGKPHHLIPAEIARGALQEWEGE